MSLSRCLPTGQQMLGCLCPHKEHKKEVKALVEKGLEKMDLVKDAADKIGNKTSFMERRKMHGKQGYLPKEAVRQIHNCFEEWDPERSESYFGGVLVSEYLKYANSKGGSIEPDAAIWR